MNVADSGEDAVRPRRAAVACTRCRRFRTKCIAAPPFSDPCQNCVKSNVRDQCYFPARGEVDVERTHRRKRAKQAHRGDEAASPKHCPSPQRSRSVASSTLPSADATSVLVHDSVDVVKPSTAAAELPEPLEIIQAIESFSKCYFQISFLPQAFLLENIKERPECISRFLLLSILTVAAPWTSTFVKKYGGSRQAGEHFYGQAKMMLATEMLKPTLQACQSFFLLSIYQWGHGNSEEASMLVSVSVRMLGLLGLHRESSYTLGPNASSEEVTMSEVARRSFWAVVTHEHLASGLNRLASIRLDEIETLLPGDESDFSFGVQTDERVSLHGTIPYNRDPSTATSYPRSLFASMVQSHALWAKVAQWACQGTRDKPWLPSSDFARLQEELEVWYNGLPPRQRWSKQNLRGMLAEGKDIPFLSHICCYKLAGVVLRRKYLASMAAALEPDGTLDESILAPEGFWQEMAKDMVQKSYDLISTIDDFFKLRATKLGFAAILIFGLYISGSVCLYLQRWPTLCPQEVPHATRYLELAIETLSDIGSSWPMATAWHESLRNSARNSQYNGWGALKAAAAAERSADEAVGIFRHTNTTNPVPVTSPSFSGRAYGPQSDPSASSISPEALQLRSPNRISSLEAGHVSQSGYDAPQPQYQQPQQFAAPEAFPATLSSAIIPAAGMYTSVSNQPYVTPNLSASFAAPQQQVNTYESQYDLGHAFINTDVPSIFPLTNDGIPYDAFEDDLVAFFRGDVPSYLDTFSFPGQSGTGTF